MVRLKVTAKGQITLKREVLDHLGVKPGDEVDVNLTPKGEVTIHPIAGKLPIERVFGMFKNTTGRSYSIEDINEAIAASYAGEAEQ
ncbi:AbrB/MazE/SpoVT family DNA-binding domain-containing protein [Neorhizobium sp. DT-125]|uniref:AbrB/MazE/SpoVT family DNA-binding domain-containing protein n=1 Tax=Neorhizobium sp. DT-125 TaxID=3396163 RepID=UPI003F1DD7B8